MIPVVSKYNFSIFAYQKEVKIMQVLVEIPDNKANFGLEVLRNLVFVKKASPISGEKAVLIQEIKEAVDNLILVKQGKLKAKPARELLDEL